MNFLAFREKWASKRQELARISASVSADALIGDVLADLEELERDRSVETVSATEAARIAGVHPDTVGRWIAQKKVANYGTRARPLVRLSDIPKKADGASIAVAPPAPKSHTSATGSASLLLDAVASRQRRG